MDPITVNGTAVRLVNSSISDNSVHTAAAGVIRSTSGAKVWLENVSMHRNHADILLSGPEDPDEFDVHSDVPRTVLTGVLKNQTQPPPTDTTPFISPASSWFVDVRRVCHHFCVLLPTTLCMHCVKRRTGATLS